LLEDLPSARAGEIADVRGHHDSIIPRQRDGGFQIRSHGESRHPDALRQVEFLRRSAASESHRPHDTRDNANDRIICRTRNRSIMMQVSIGHLCEPLLNFLRFGQNRFATHVARRCDQRGAEVLKQ